MTLQELQQAIAKLEQTKGWVDSPDEKITFITEERVKFLNGPEKLGIKS